MKNVIVTLAVLGALGCSSSDSPAPDPGTSDTGSVPTDSGPTCTQNGAAACSTFLDARCARYVKCCNPTGSDALSACNAKCQNLVSGSATNYNACNQDACKAWTIRAKFDCASTAFTSKTVCSAPTTACVNDYPLVACSDITAGTANEPTTCKTFLAQFGL